MTKPKAKKPLPLKIEYRPLRELVLDPRNPRKHSPEQIALLVGSIREFGFNAPVLTDGELGVIDGHGRIEAARQLGLDVVPVIELSHLDPEQKRLYKLAANRLAELASWDEVLLEQEMDELRALGADVDLVGFDDSELEEAEPDIETIETDAIADRFWISVRGPLADQAAALLRLRDLMKEFPAVEVELGTTQDVRS